MKSTVHDSLVPPGLMLEIHAVAVEEGRDPGEIVGEALERYLSQRKWFRDADVHAKIAQGLESLRQGKGLDGEAVMAELLEELDEPNAAFLVSGYLFSPCSHRSRAPGTVGKTLQFCRSSSGRCFPI